MVRSRPAALACAVVLFTLAPRVPAADPVDRTLAVQAAIAQARELLTANQSARAVEVLERHLTAADGSRAYLDLLRSAYAAECKRLQLTNADPARVAAVRNKLAVLGGAAAEPPAPLPAPTVTAAAPPADPAPAAPAFDGVAALQKAKALFDQARAEPGKYGVAGRLFADAFLHRVEMSPDQLAAWAYCRVRVAADRFNQSDRGPAAAAEAAAEVEAALKLAPAHAKLQQAGAEVVATIRQRAGGAAVGRAAASPVVQPVAAAADGWEVVETASFVVRHAGRRPLAEAVARAAEAKREELFSRWSGPAPQGWSPKCEVVLHPTADAFAAATQQPPAANGRAVVRLDGGQAVERRIDLRADAETAAPLVDDALPRELSYVVLASLFADKAPPKWAEVGMAVLACSPAEVDRYKRTLARCAQTGRVFTVGDLIELPAPPAAEATLYYVESVSLVDFLVRWKGEKAFVAFLRDADRYGQQSALKRQYGVADVRQLEAMWTRAELGTTARGQAQ